MPLSGVLASLSASAGTSCLLWFLSAKRVSRVLSLDGDRQWLDTGSIVTLDFLAVTDVWLLKTEK